MLGDLIHLVQADGHRNRHANQILKSVGTGREQEIPKNERAYDISTILVFTY